MAYVDLVLCKSCYGSGRIIAAVTGDSEDVAVAGTIKPCPCVSGVEAITEDGEVLSIGVDVGTTTSSPASSGKLPHHGEPMDRPS